MTINQDIASASAGRLSGLKDARESKKTAFFQQNLLPGAVMGNCSSIWSTSLSQLPRTAIMREQPC
jgi:hypothetical protein